MIAQKQTNFIDGEFRKIADDTMLLNFGLLAIGLIGMITAFLSRCNSTPSDYLSIIMGTTQMVHDLMEMVSMTNNAKNLRGHLTNKNVRRISLYHKWLEIKALEIRKDFLIATSTIVSLAALLATAEMKLPLTSCSFSDSWNSMPSIDVKKTLYEAFWIS